MGFLNVFRFGVFVAVTVFAIVELGLTADITKFANSYYKKYDVGVVLNLAVAVITILSIPTILLLDFLSVKVWILVELAWTALIWILWLAGAADVTHEYNHSYSAFCSHANDYNVIADLYGEESILNDFKKTCKEVQAVAAFAFINWIFLMLYFFTLLAFAIIGIRKGGIWLESVKTANSGDTATATAPAMKEAPAEQAQTA
ncbi:hypothetical protein FISHEDRAFT_60576 [Fistulina hepatica ATCC 64428]|uniref:MARVEL domain-containing protein n=1 Tax=Fistulina hepatica ATCC 64428 TaxID=1128425 RepID=A0A0D7A5K0_9AGAR|nr:hypothetical protein FISHEDRAFT_60576 [Fistulina hepatica ATCC 64428]